MASGTMSKMPSRSLVVNDALNVTGRGLSPRPSPPSTPGDATMRSAPTSSRSSISDDDEEGSEKSEEYTVLDGVREMNQILVRQIETLRLKIKVDEQNYDKEKARLVDTKDSEIRTKETEIEDLRESLTNRDDKIHQLMKASEEKDRTIRNKSEEIEELKKMVRQTKEYAQKIQKQVGRVRHQKDKLESDPLYKQQNAEITRLTEELEVLRSSLTTMEQELARAMKVIDQQNEKIKYLDSEKVVMQAKFREELDKASKAMRQEVERMREVMRQNYEEMRILREQNREMHSDVRDIKEMLKAARTGGGNPQSNHGVVTGIQRPLTASPVPSYARRTHGQTTAVAPKGPGKMVGGSITSTASRRQFQTQSQAPMVREKTLMRRGNFRTSPNRTSIGSEASGQQSTNTTSRLTPDVNSKPLTQGQTPRVDDRFLTVQNLHVPRSNQNAAQDKNLPPIASLKEEVPVLARQPSGRMSRAGIRKGSAVKK